MGTRLRRRRRDRRGRTRGVGRTAHGRRRRAATRATAERHPRLEDAHRARPRTPLRPGRRVVRDVGRRPRLTGRVRRARDGRRPAVGDSASARSAVGVAERGDRGRELGLRHASCRPRRAGDQGRRPVPRRVGGEHPRQGHARPDHAASTPSTSRRGRSTPTRATRAPPTSPRSRRGARRRSTGARGCSWTTTSRGRASNASTVSSRRKRSPRSSTSWTSWMSWTSWVSSTSRRRAGYQCTPGIRRMSA